MPETLEMKTFFHDEGLFPTTSERTVPKSSWRPPEGVCMISADDHFQETENLWQDYMPAKWKDRAPRYYYAEGDGWHLEIDGKEMIPPGLGRRAERGIKGEYDPDARLAAMDEEGIFASLLFPQWSMALSAVQDEDLYIACANAYNEWIADFMRPYADRLIPVAICPAWKKKEIARESMQMIKDLGFKAVQLPSSPRGVRYNSMEMDGLFAAIEDSGLPLSFHVGAVMEFKGTGSLGANLMNIFGPFRGLLGQLVFSGILERHPNLQVIFTEGGAGWAGQAITDMDFIYRTYGAQLRPKLPHKPSTYWYRQCATTFMVDPTAMQIIDILGADNVLWSLDYPHTESTYGFSGEIAESIWNTLGPEKGAKVLGGNAARIWKIGPDHAQAATQRH